jgi:hypothetical protein
MELLDEKATRRDRALVLQTRLAMPAEAPNSWEVRLEPTFEFVAFVVG